MPNCISAPVRASEERDVDRVRMDKDQMNQDILESERQASPMDAIFFSQCTDALQWGPVGCCLGGNTD